MPRSLDEARRLNPGLGFALYAIEPRGAVVLEILDGEQVFAFRGVSEAEVWATAFPDAPAPSDPSADAGVDLSVFD